MPLPAIENLIPLALVAGGGLVAWGELRGRVNNLKQDVDDKASRDVMEAHFEAVLQRLTRIEEKLDRSALGGRE